MYIEDRLQLEHAEFTFNQRGDIHVSITAKSSAVVNYYNSHFAFSVDGADKCIKAPYFLLFLDTSEFRLFVEWFRSIGKLKAVEDAK